MAVAVVSKSSTDSQLQNMCSTNKTVLFAQIADIIPRKPLIIYAPLFYSL